MTTADILIHTCKVSGQNLWLYRHGGEWGLSVSNDDSSGAFKIVCSGMHKSEMRALVSNLEKYLTFDFLNPSESETTSRFELKERHYGRSFDLVTLVKYAKEGKQFYCKTPESGIIYNQDTLLQVEAFPLKWLQDRWPCTEPESPRHAFIVMAHSEKNSINHFSKIVVEGIQDTIEASDLNLKGSWKATFEPLEDKK